MRVQFYALSVFGVAMWCLIFMRLQGGFVDMKENVATMVKSMRGVHVINNPNVERNRSHGVVTILEHEKKNYRPIMAVCACTRSKPDWKHFAQTAVARYLIPSLERTVTQEERDTYDMRLYICHDDDDMFWERHKKEIQVPDWLTLEVLVYKKQTKHKIPFNPFMRDVYESGAEYMTRINDDTEFMTSGWVSNAIVQLKKMDNVGVVGPTCREGNQAILTHDMVHRTHLEIFDTYYSDVFSAWWVDDWITRVYEPGRMVKMRDWVVKHHTGMHGTRYTPQMNEEKFVGDEVRKGQERLKRWLDKLKIYVLTMNREKSLKRLLSSLENTYYGNQHVELHIHVDKSNDNAGCIDVAKTFKFSHGDVHVSIAQANNGLRDAWFSAWRPSKYERAIVFEDDIEVSPTWFSWLQKAWDTYYEREDVAGITLQRQTLIPQKPSKYMEIVNNHKPFLYRLVGSIGFSPHWKHWRAFLEWIDSIDRTKVNIETPSLVTSDWFNTLDKRHMWTQYFIWFCKQHDLYTLYVNLKGKKTLASHMRERGEHYYRTEGRDFALATRVEPIFPEDLTRYGWDGMPEKDHYSKPISLVTDGTEYGGWTYDSSSLTQRSIIYSVGLGEDTSWDEGISNRFGLEVWGFDPTPKSVAYVQSNHKLGSKFHFTPEGLGVKKEVLTFTKPKNPNHVSIRRGVHDNMGEVIELPVNSLENWMKKFHHTHIDILKLDIEGSEYDVLEDWIKRKWFPMHQLLIEFHQRFYKDKTRHNNILHGLRTNGFELIYDKGGNGQEMSFIKRTVTKSIPKNIEQHYLQKAKLIQKENSVVNIQLLNEGYVEMTKSWICNVKKFPNVLKKTLFITTDKNAYNELSNFDHALNIVLEEYSTPTDLTYGQYAYYDFMLFRTKLLVNLLKHNVTIWLTESDAVWLKDPTDVVLKTNGDMVTMSDGMPPEKILQGGFQLLRPTKLTISVWTKLLDTFQRKMDATKIGTYMNDSGSEQLMLNQLIQQENGLHMAWLDWHLFAPGLYYKSPQKWNKPFVILNNWIAGNLAKINRAKKYKHWFLNNKGTCLN